MNYEQAKQIVERAVGQLAESLERGRSEELKSYLAAMAKFPRYSLHNILLILAQRPDTVRVAGYHTWKSLGRIVKRGAKGILILAPLIRHSRSRSASETEENATRLAGFRGVHVFAQEDTEGQPLPALSECHGDPSVHTARLKEFVVARNVQVEYSDAIRPAFGQCSVEKIVLLPDLSAAMEFAVLAHEVGHLLLHFGPNRRELSKQVRETEAEAVAFVACNAIGLEAVQSASEYILLYAGDKKLFSESLENIRRAGSDIVAAISPASA
jgi:hypothetical protein